VIRLFGPLTIEDGGRTLGPRDLGGARPKQVLEILLAARGHHVATDRLADLLWPEHLKLAARFWRADRSPQPPWPRNS
jgi:DNA-binding SARP family transcriptional activator